MKPSWLTVLDDFEHHLDGQVELIAAGRYDEVVAFVPPKDLPPLPKALVARALWLLDRAQALTEHGSAIRDDTVQRIAQTRTTAFAPRATSVYVDQQA
jgi:hypothetical protein